MLALNRRRYFMPAAAAALSSACVVGGAVLTVPRAHAQAAQAAARAVTLSLFRGETSDSGNIGLGSWGSGKVESAKEAVLVGTTSLKITTQGYYQGGRLDFKEPVDLSTALQNPRTYMRFQTRFTGSGSSQQGFDPSNLQTTARAASPFKNMRFLLVMADGTRYELIRPVELPVSEDPDAYAPLTFPLAALAKKITVGGKALPTGDGAKLKQMAIFGDRYAQFYIGEIGVVTDETDITTSPLEDQVFFAQQPTAFVGNAEGGATTLHYSWDFDASDGIQKDAVGRITSHVFPRVGTSKDASGKDRNGQATYTVTLTVSDVDGLKKPVTVTQEVQVTD